MAKEILIHQPIGGWYGINSALVLGQLAEAKGGDVLVRINSPGGSVFDGIAIYNALTAHKGTVDVVVEGVAASAASIVAMAGKTVRMAQGSMLMIHNAMADVFGNADELESTAATLRKISTQLAGIYAQRTGLTAEAAQEMMDAETWLDAEDAIAKGFADAKVPGRAKPVPATPEAKRIAASWRNAPSAKLHALGVSPAASAPATGALRAAAIATPLSQLVRRP